MSISFFVTGAPGASAEETPPASQVTIMEQDFTSSSVIPENVVMGNTLGSVVDATLTYNGGEDAIEYRTATGQMGSAYLGVEPFVDGTLSLSLRVSSDNWGSGVYITGSTFQIYTQTLTDGRARVYSQYYSSPTLISYRSYEVPASAMIGGVNTINIEVSGTAKSVTVYHDETRRITTPMYSTTVQSLPYEPVTLPIVRFTNERSSSATFISTFLYGVKETVSGGLVTAAPGNDLVPFGIDVPREEGNLLGTTYMAERGHHGVVWADEYWLESRPDQIPYLKSLLDQGWELGIHYSQSLNTLPTAEALTYMETAYNHVKDVFGRSPTSWCSLENKDNATHARFAYENLGMLWRNAQWYIPNAGSLVESTWPAFWARVSPGQLVTPSFTHFTDQTGTINDYAISLPHFTTWIDNYAGKKIIGFNEYYHRMWNQVDTTIQYQSYTPGTELKFTVGCNEFPTRLLINFTGAGDAVVKKNGVVLANNTDYKIVGNDRIILLARSGDALEITSSGAPSVPSAPGGLQGVAGNAQAELNWSVPAETGSGSLTYHLFRDSELIWSGTELSFIDTGLTNGQQYRYTVAANNSAGWGPNSTEVLVTPLGTPSAPRGLTAVPGDGRVDLNWTAPADNGSSDITGYRLYRGTSAGQGTVLATLGVGLEYSDTTATNGVTYYYNVTAVNAVGEGPSSQEVSATPAAVITTPSAPRDLAAAAAGGQVVLTWSAPSADGGAAITEYKIYRGTASGSETLLATVGDVLTYTDTSVSNGQVYYYQVSAVNSAGEGPLSNEVSATPSAVPTAPQNLEAAPGNGQVTLSWSAPSDDGGSAITGYKIYRGTTSGGETLLTAVGNELTYTDLAVTNGITYYYRISALNAAGEGTQSTEISATPATPASTPSAPQDLLATPSNGQVTLAWSAPTSDGGSAVTDYKVYRGTAPGGGELLATIGNLLTYTDTSAVNGQIYYYTVSAVNTVGEGPKSSEASATPSTTPSTPHSVEANAGDAQVVLTWTAPANDGGSAITGYKIYRSTTSGTETLLTAVGNVLTYTDGSLTNGQTYYYTISAVNGVGEGPQSSEVSSKPVAVPSAPQDLAANGGDAQTVLTWTAPSSNGGNAITNYRIYRGIAPGAEVLLTTVGNVLTFTDTTVTNGQVYYYRVSAVNSVGEGLMSSEVSTSPAAVPSAPRSVVATAGNAQIALSWQAPLSDGGSAIANYKIYRSTTPGTETLFTTVGNVLTYTDTSVTNGQAYYYTISAVNGVGEGQLSAEASAIPATVPSAPTIISAAPGDAQVVLTWTAPSSNGGNAVTGYKIYRGTTAGGETLLTTAGNVLTYTDGSLTNGQTYYYKVSAVNSVGEGSLSNEISAVPAATPSAPQNLAPTAGNAQVSLAWDAPAADGGSVITGYKIYRGLTPGSEVLLTTLGNVHSYTDPSVTNGQTYYYRVAAVNAIGEGALSAEVSATPAVPATVPSAPQSLVATPGNAQVTLTWTAPSSNGGSTITGYKLYRGTSSGAETLLTTLGNVLTYNDAAVTNGATYYYVVTAVNGVGEGAGSNEASATPTTAPSAPTISSAIPGNAQIALTWTAPTSTGGSDITGYKIYRGTTSGGETLLTAVGNELTYIDVSVTNGLTYYYKISAVNGAGEGPQSSEVSAKPSTTPSAPQNLIATGGDGQVALTWSAPSSEGGAAIDYYAVYRDGVDIAHPSAASYTDTGLTNGQSYSYYVRAHNVAGLGASSNTVSGTPHAPNIAVTSPSADQVWYKNTVHTITWTAAIAGNVRLDVVQGTIVVYTIAANTANDGTEDWTVPFDLAAGSGYQIRVSAVNDQTDFAVSAGKITVPVTAVTVTSPDASSVWVAGSRVTVRWTSAGTIPGLRVELLKAGSVVQTLAASTVNDGSQVFTLPFTLAPGSDYVIRLTNTTNAQVADSSDPFTVRSPALTVTYPNGGETIVAGSSVNIQWGGDMSLLGRVSITLWKGGSQVLLIASGTTNDGAYTWTSSYTLAPGTDYVIRVTPLSYAQFYDQSDSPFTVRKATLTVTSPTAGASYARSTTMNILWQRDNANIGYVRIELYKDGVLSRMIVSSTANDGAYAWRIPSTLAAGSYQVKISSVYDPSIVAWSGAFNIT